ncbi:MAG TPA: CsbD family protein [Acidobacteriaceae bacterium]|jgi:uncharacterized protein YjbJ (UPF0337 family)|nr:CsbD family protein [Acidobacteriaceae bacterium]
MNHDTAAGKFDQLKGKAKQSVGEALGNQRLANSGTADQVKGAVQEAWGNAKDAVHAISGEACASASTKHCEVKQSAADTAHDVRERIVSTAQNVKDAVSAKSEAIQREHTHTV